MLGYYGIPHHDLVLASPAFRDLLMPDFILHIGGRLTSKRLLKSLADWDHVPYFRPTDRTRVEPDNPHSRPMRVGLLSTASRARLFAEASGDFSSYAGPVREMSVRFRLALDVLFASDDVLSEAGVCRTLARLQEPGDGLYCAASLPVRLLDAFTCAWQRCNFSTSTEPIDFSPVAPPRVVANRGASGIDGTICSAAGFAIALAVAPTTLVIGDIAMLHDLNGLALARQVETPMPIVVLNNDGGGIFELLPIRETAPAQFERFFGTPHGMNFMHAAAQFGVPYSQPQTMADFADAYEAARQRPGPTLIEVRTDRRETARLWRDAQDLAREVCGE
jgi:2-succinyl-5-enolpyruvyl-6-hydroxy-3-cyclohexene-1-carboxylate synthase